VRWLTAATLLSGEGLLTDGGYLTLKIGAYADFGGYFFAGVADGRRVPVAQLFTDLGQRAAGLMADKVHCYLPG